MNRKSHPQGVFIIALYLVFAIFTLALTAVSASVYENITSGMEENHSVRTALSYISTKMRQADDITVNNGVLEIAEEDCISRIYFHNGHITEHFGEADMEFEADYGEGLIPADSFEITEQNGSIYLEIGINNAVYPLIFSQK